MSLGLHAHQAVGETSDSGIEATMPAIPISQYASCGAGQNSSNVAKPKYQAIRPIRFRSSEDHDACFPEATSPIWHCRDQRQLFTSL
jgi:hypothetical protein